VVTGHDASVDAFVLIEGELEPELKMKARLIAASTA
jgi:hypothetical protein